MRKFKFFIMGVSLFMILPFIYITADFDHDLNANSIDNQGVQFDLYDRVVTGSSVTSSGRSYYLGNVINNRNGHIRILDTRISSFNVSSVTTYSFLYGEAMDRVNKKNNITDVQRSAQRRFISRNDNFYTIPTTQDLEMVMENGKLNAALPFSGEPYRYAWWLGDEPVNNRAKVVSASNELDSPVSYKKMVITKDTGYSAECEQESWMEYGVVPVVDEPVEGGSTELIESKSMEVQTKLVAGGNWSNISSFQTPGCTAGTGTGSKGMSGTTKNAPVTVTWDGKSPTFKMSPKISGWGPTGLFMSQMSIKDFIDQTPATVSKTFLKNTCYDVSNTNLINNSPKKVYGYKMTSAYDGTIEVTFANPKIVKMTKTCDTITNKAGKYGIRILNSFSNSDVLLKNTEKRDVTTATNHLDQDFPISDEDAGKSKPAYLTVKDIGQSLVLKNDSESAKDKNTIKMDIPSDYIVNIPFSGVNFSTSGSAKVSVSASAKINGKTKYGILKSFDKIEKDQAFTVPVDLRDFAEDPSTLKKINFTLYMETDEQSPYTFMSEPLDVTILFDELVIDTPKADQKIAFDPDQPTTAIYGEPITLISQLTSDIDVQSMNDIKYSILSGNARIQDQGYENGIGTATILPTNGVGDVTIAINKAGDENANDAITQTHTIHLQKKPISIHPKPFTKLYAIGTSMPALSSISDDLAAGDTLLPELIPHLENVDASGPALPFDTNNRINATGIWKLVYADDLMDTLPSSDATTAFKSKYEPTFVGYEADQTYVFETAIADVPAGWIEVTEPNEHGWNTTDVLIQPSADAINAGYTMLEVMNADGSAKSPVECIRYDTDLKITPRVRLVKGGAKSNVVTLREIKIDHGTPKADVTVIDEDLWTTDKKIVHITIQNETFSNISSVTMTREGSAASYSATKDNQVYTFEADQNGIYYITIVNEAGTSVTYEKEIQKIDTDTVSVQANALAFANPDDPFGKLTQTIELTISAGSSGIQSLVVLYQNDREAAVELETITDYTTNPYSYIAKMNGSYQFVLTNQAGKTVSSNTVRIEELNPPRPCTKVDAVYSDDHTVQYQAGTWTNHDITLLLRNVNLDLDGALMTWEVSEDGISWNEAVDDSIQITTQTAIQKTYQVRAKFEQGGQVIYEASPKVFTVNIDKTAPHQPSIKNAERYTQDAWFKEDVHVEADYTAKTTGIKEALFVCEGTKAYCETKAAVWTRTGNPYTLSTNTYHEIYFKVIDAAGNESEISEPAYININAHQPTIKIKVKENDLTDFLNQLTLGYFFKETIDVKAEVDFGTAQGGEPFHGKTYIIIDEGGSQAMPDAEDDWGSERASTSIEPSKTVMIYVKAVSDAGVTTIASSEYHVYVDNEPPVIEAQNMSDWGKEDHLSIRVSDTVSGLDPSALFYILEDGTKLSYQVNRDQEAIINQLPDGTSTIEIHAGDLSGNTSEEHVAVMIDTSAPSIEEPTFVTGWAKEREITVAVSDRHSGLKQNLPITVKDSSGSNLSVTNQTNGSYSFVVKANDTYTITAMDQAGNSGTMQYTETQIDTKAPIISNIQIEKEHDISSSKLVTFDIQEETNTAVLLAVTYQENGEDQPVPYVSLDEHGRYQFTVNKNATYTIKAIDQAGNISTETVSIHTIDTEGMQLILTSDINVWTKDEKTVSFEVVTGKGTLADGYPKVKKGERELSVQAASQSSGYEFTADENSIYTIEVQNTGGDMISKEIDIRSIDGLAPVIRNASDHTTDTAWRDPIIVEFHVYDFNSMDKSTFGSGIAQGYPTVSYIEADRLLPVQVQQDAGDASLYRFRADRNGIYRIHAKDVVAHDPVEVEISVDHIIEDQMKSDIKVTAESNGMQVSSQDWVREELIFTLSGGLDSSLLLTYEVAVTDGDAPQEDDWAVMNMPQTHQHKITEEQRGKAYWFRTNPIGSVQVSEPFLVNLDDTPPTKLEIIKTRKHTDLAAQMLHALSFGQWMKEGQEVTFQAEDNFTDSQDLRFYYAEEIQGVLHSWKEVQEPLSYDSIDLKLHVKAVDLAGNESDVIVEPLMIDVEAPTISGVKDQSVYKQYYLPRFLSVYDEGGSGFDSAYYAKDSATPIPIQDGEEVKVEGVGTYEVAALDRAGNEKIIHFVIVPLPDLSQIDGTDESKEIIEQIKQELNENKDKLDQLEKDDTNLWLDDAQDRWDKARLDKLEHKESGSIVEGIEDTTFDPTVKLIVEPVNEAALPELPRKPLAGYDVYLKKGEKVVSPNGAVKVLLPYHENASPIVYAIDEGDQVQEVSAQIEGEFVAFTTPTLMKYAISNKNQEVNKPIENPDGSITVPGGDGDITVKPNPDGEKPSIDGDGNIVVPPGGGVVGPDGETQLPDGGIVILPDGTIVPNPPQQPENPDQPTQNPDGSITVPGGDGDITIKPNPDGEKPSIDGDGNIVVPPGGGVVGPDGETQLPDGGIVILPDGTIVPNPPQQPEDPDQPIENPDGSITVPGGDGDITVKPNPDGEKPSIDGDGNIVVPPGGGVVGPDGEVEYPGGGIITPDGEIKPNDPGNAVQPDLDADQDGKPDLNIDYDCDGVADLNIDLNKDGIPEINIDTTGDGKPDYNIDLNKDGKPDINIGPVRWEPNKCTVTACGKPYCTSTYKQPRLNIDTDNDSLPDVNLDFNGDRIPELNIDINFDTIPDLDIDSIGDGKPNINIDFNGDGIADLNLVKLSVWTPNHNAKKGHMNYDTMTNLTPLYNIDQNGDGKAEEHIVDNKDNSYILSGKETGGGQTTQSVTNQQINKEAVAGSTTGETNPWIRWGILFTISVTSMSLSLYRNYKRKQKLMSYK